MDAKRREDISVLIQKILARKYRCGLAGEHAVRDLWDENVELRERVKVLEGVAMTAEKPAALDDIGKFPKECFHLIICDGSFRLDKCTCGMDQLRAALRAYNALCEGG